MRRALLPLLVLALAAAATAQAAKAPNACGLLTKAELAAAMGEAVSSAKGGRSSQGAVFCNWVGKDEGLFPKGISLIAAGDNAKARYDGYKSLLEKRKLVAGIGVAAVTDGNVILARSAGAVVQIGATYPNSGISLAKIKSLAKTALARAATRL